jgi:hypothetical protein
MTDHPGFRKRAAGRERFLPVIAWAMVQWLRHGKAMRFGRRSTAHYCGNSGLGVRARYPPTWKLSPYPAPSAPPAGRVPPDAERDILGQGAPNVAAHPPGCTPPPLPQRSGRTSQNRKCRHLADAAELPSLVRSQASTDPLAAVWVVQPFGPKAMSRAEGRNFPVSAPFAAIAVGCDPVAGLWVVDPRFIVPVPDSARGCRPSQFDGRAYRYCHRLW